MQQYKTIDEILTIASQEKNSNELFADFFGEKVTYKRLIEESNKVCSFLQLSELKKGDKIVLSSSNDYYTSLLFISFLKYGIVTVLLDPESPAARAKSIIEKVNAVAYVMDEKLFAERGVHLSQHKANLSISAQTQKKGKLFNQLLKNKKTEHTIIQNQFPEILNTLAPSKPINNHIEKNDLAYIIFTSGTTSAPKGVMISHENLFSHLETLSNVYKFTHETPIRIHNILMLYHSDGCIQGPLLTLYNKASLYHPFKFEVSKIDELFASIYKYRITHLVTVPTILSFMMKFSENFEDSFLTEDFQYIISCAAKLEKRLWIDLELKFNKPIINIFGLTETVTGSIFSGVDQSNRRVGSVGKPVDCEAKILLENGNIAQPNEQGILYIKGSHVFSGYLNDETTTATVKKDGWFNTGDIAVSDDDGFIYITGRQKNTINTGGFNVYPEQVAEVINTHPAIKESVCLGIPDDFFGEKIIAVYAVNSGSSLDELTLLEYIRPQLEAHQIPKEFYVMTDLPKGLSGKIKLDEVKNHILTTKTGTASLTDAQNFEKMVLQIAAEAFGIRAENVHLNDRVGSLEGWDSMGHLDLITSLEKNFSLKFSTAEMISINTLSDALRIISQKKSQR